MSPENTPSQVTEATPEQSYAEAVNKQQMEANILANGDNFDQDRVDTVLGQKAFEAVLKPIEVNQAGADLLADLTTPESEEDSDVLATAAAQRQLDMNSIFKKQDFDARAVSNNWTEDKYQEELEKAGLK